MSILNKYPELKTGIVNLKSGTVFQGVIWKKRRDLLILRSAKVLQDRGNRNNDPKIVDGEILLFNDQIDFIQII